MRPNIDISHQLNGRIKDYAEANDLSIDAAYKEIIRTGLEDLEDDERD